MAQDSAGLLWFGTEDGLNQYDGSQVRIFRNRLDQPDSLLSSWICALLEDHRGEFWVLTSKGLSRFERKNSHFEHMRLPRDSEGWALAEDGNGTLWLACDDGLYRVGPDRRSLTQVNGLDGQHGVRALMVDGASLWVGSWGGGLVQLDLAGKLLFSSADQPSLERLDKVRHIARHPQGGLWLGTANGLVHFTPGTMQVAPFFHQDGSECRDQVTATLSGPEPGSLLVGTVGMGLHYLRPNSKLLESVRHTPSRVGSINSDTIWCLLRDRTDTIWLGNGNSSGLNLYVPPVPMEAVAIPGVWSILTDQQEGFWAATYRGLYHAFGDQRPTELLTHSEENPQSLSSNRLWRLADDAYGRIWIGTDDRGLNCMDTATGRIKRYDQPGLATLDIQAMYSDRKRWLWFSANKQGLYRLDLRSDLVDRVTNPPGIADEALQIYSFEQARSGGLWLGSDRQGLLRMDAQGVFMPAPKLSHGPDTSEPRIWSLYEDDAGALWVGTQGEGLYQISSEQAISHWSDANSGLTNNTIHAILPDRQDRLWLSTNWGLSVLDLRSRTIFSYGLPDGLQDAEFNLAAAYLADDGEMFFGGVRGVNRFRPERLQPVLRVPDLLVNVFSARGRALYDGSTDPPELRLDYFQNTLQLELSILEFVDPAHVRYTYRLEGVDEQWVAINGRSHPLTYASLAPGSYLFRVKARDHNGSLSREVCVPIRVTPPYWRTFPFWIVLIFLLMLFLLASLRRYHRRRRESAKNIEDALESERNAWRDFLHDGPLGGLTALRISCESLSMSQQLDQLERREVVTRVQQLERDLRSFLSGVFPALEEMDLAEAMRDFIRYQNSDQIQVEFIVDLQIPLNKSFQRLLYRVFSKCYANIVKHAQAKQVKVLVVANPQRVTFIVSDDGQGFKVPLNWGDEARRGHFGLWTVQRDVKAYGGVLTVTSTPNQGTVVKVQINAPLRMVAHIK